MKTSASLFLKFILLFLVIKSFGQNSGTSFNYSEVARNATGEPMVNSNIQVQIALHFGNSTNLASYIENHTSQTDNNGKFTVVIGNGTPISGNYSNLPWGLEKSFVETFVNGISISNKEVSKPRAFGKLMNTSKIGIKKPQASVNKNVTDMNLNDIPLTQIQIGNKTLKPGNGIMFTGKSPTHTIHLQNQLSITAGDGIEISGEYPHLTISLKKHEIGEEYLGGKIAYLDETGLHGFVVHDYLMGPANWNTFKWGHELNNDISPNEFLYVGNGHQKEGIGYGWGNTMNLLKEDNIDLNVVDVGEVESIPQVLDNFENQRWFLPSIGELKEIYKNRTKLGFSAAGANMFVWSSNIDYSNQIYQGHNDKFNGTNYDPNENEPYNINERIHNKIKLGNEKVYGIKCLNFSSGREVSILAAYRHHFFLIREF